MLELIKFDGVSILDPPANQADTSKSDVKTKRTTSSNYNTVQSTESSNDNSDKTTSETSEVKIENPQNTSSSNSKSTDGSFDWTSKDPDTIKRTASKYLQKELSLTPIQIAGLLGNWDRESGFILNAENADAKAGLNPNVKPSGADLGIGQWTNKRRESLLNFAKSRNSGLDLKTQLDFAVWEIRNKYPDFLENLRKAKSVEESTAYAYTQYVAGGEHNIKDVDDLMRRVRNIEQRYINLQIKMHGKDSGNHYNKRVEAARKLIFNKRGGILKRV